MDSYLKFVEYFIQENILKPECERLPPFRLVEDCLKEAEAAGHAAEWAAQYLFHNKCPVHWLSAICAETSNRIRNEDLSYCIRPASAKSKNDDTENESGNSCKYLDARKLCHLTFQTVEKVIQDWSDSPPNDISEVCNNHPHTISHHAIRNTRRKMEDRHIIVPSMSLYTDNKNYKDSSLYAVFDGHGGVDASCYAASQFLCNLLNQSGEDKSKALIEAYKSTDEGFCEKAKREHLNSGSTAVSLLVDSQNLYISWLGDSQAILVRDGRAIDIMDPHKPEREDEKARIEALGGCVVFFGSWRVNGTLAVSRALGDVDHKPYVSNEPDTRQEQITPDCEYLIVACDGLWDTVDPHKAVELVHKHVTMGNSYESVAEMLVKAAKVEGSSDNISVIVVFFKKELSSPKPASSKPKETDPVEEAREDCTDQGADMATQSQPQIHTSNQMLTNQQLTKNDSNSHSDHHNISTISNKHSVVNHLDMEAGGAEVNPVAPDSSLLDQRVDVSHFYSVTHKNELNHISLKRPKTSNGINRKSSMNKTSNAANIYKEYERQLVMPKPPVPFSKQIQKPKGKRKIVNTNHVQRERSGSFTYTISSLSPHSSRDPSPARSDVGSHRDVSPYRIHSGSRRIFLENKQGKAPANLRQPMKSAGKRNNTKLPPISVKQSFSQHNFEE